MVAEGNLTGTNRSTVHELTPQQSCADRGRQNFIFHLKRQLGQVASTGLQNVVRSQSHGADPSFEQSSNALQDSPAFAAWNALSKGAQRQMWRSLSDMIDRQNEHLDEQVRKIATRPVLGSLELDPNFDLPDYLSQHAFHGQPGGYIDSRHDQDIRAGALQEAGGTLYSRGIGTGKKDSKAAAVVRYLGQRFPDFSPKRILDLGCGHGGQTCGYALAYPDAQTHGIDAGEAVLRYGHFRAQSMGIELHLHQADAAAPPFPDGYFDLVVSNILLHEVPTETMKKVMAQCHRLTASGGVTIHQDVPTQKADTPGFRQFLSMWQTQHNDEPFWEAFARSSVPEALVSAGFAVDQVFEDYARQLDGPLTWYLVGAQKS